MSLADGVVAKRKPRLTSVVSKAEFALLVGALHALSAEGYTPSGDYSSTNTTREVMSFHHFVEACGKTETGAGKPTSTV